MNRMINQQSGREAQRMQGNREELGPNFMIRRCHHNICSQAVSKRDTDAPVLAEENAQGRVPAHKNMIFQN